MIFQKLIFFILINFIANSFSDNFSTNELGDVIYSYAYEEQNKVSTNLFWTSYSKKEPSFTEPPFVDPAVIVNSFVTWWSDSPYDNIITEVNLNDAVGSDRFFFKDRQIIFNNESNKTYVKAIISDREEYGYIAKATSNPNIYLVDAWDWGGGSMANHDSMILEINKKPIYKLNYKNKKLEKHENFFVSCITKFDDEIENYTKEILDILEVKIIDK